MKSMKISQIIKWQCKIPFWKIKKAKSEGLELKTQSVSIVEGV
jgi:hypothetical protein